MDDVRAEAKISFFFNWVIIVILIFRLVMLEKVLILVLKIEATLTCDRQRQGFSAPSPGSYAVEIEGIKFRSTSCNVERRIFFDLNKQGLI